MHADDVLCPYIVLGPLAGAIVCGLGGLACLQSVIEEAAPVEIIKLLGVSGEDRSCLTAAEGDEDYCSADIQNGCN